MNCCLLYGTDVYLESFGILDAMYIKRRNIATSVMGWCHYSCWLYVYLSYFPSGKVAPEI